MRVHTMGAGVEGDKGHVECTRGSSQIQKRLGDVRETKSGFRAGELTADFRVFLLPPEVCFTILPESIGWSAPKFSLTL